MTQIRKSFVIVDEQNRWLSTGYNMTPEEIGADIIEVRKRLIADGDGELDLLMFEIVGEPINIRGVKG